MLGCGEACFLNFYIGTVDGVVWSCCLEGVLRLGGGDMTRVMEEGSAGTTSSGDDESFPQSKFLL